MLGEELRKARDAAAMSQEELSFAAELDRTYISQLENDKKSPTIDVFLRICAALGTSASQIIGKLESDSSKKK